MNKNVFDLLEERGLIAQATDKEVVRNLLGNEKITFYIGFDPTADSLHVGHFLQMMVMKHMQDAGHRPIALLGGGTTMVGDPSGKSDMRRVMTKEEINDNAEKFKKQMRKFIDFSQGRALMLNNADWLLNLNYIDFLRDVGFHFSVNKMLSAEAFKIRLEKGLSFTEFNYMLMQGYDFYRLFNDENCKMQMGGNDQWSNILAGTELIRKKDAKDAFGMTFNLLTTKDGVKMGKTVKGAVWLDPEKTSPYEFFQYWRNISDEDVSNCLRLLTLVPLDKINEFEEAGGAALNEAKEILAFTLTEMVHSKEEAEKSLKTARELFSGNINSDSMPSITLPLEAFSNECINILDMLVSTNLAPSKSEARRLVQQGGIFINDEKVESIEFTLSISLFKDSLIVKKGKKTFLKVNV